MDSPPRPALCARQESPLQVSPPPPAVPRARLEPRAARRSPGTPARRCMLFLDGDSLDPLGEGGEEGKREEGREERGERRGALGQGNWWRGRKGEKEKSERFMLRIPLPLF